MVTWARTLWGVGLSVLLCGCSLFATLDPTPPRSDVGGDLDLVMAPDLPDPDDSVADEGGLEPWDAPEPLVVRPPTFRTTASEFEAVPEAVLEVRPSSVDEVWVVLVGGTLGSTGANASDGTAEARFLVDGVERGLSGSNNAVPSLGLPWFHFDRIDGASGAAVAVELRSIRGEAFLSNLVMIAFALPPYADVHFAELAAASISTRVPETYFSPFFSIREAGRYVVLATATISEAPGDALRVSLTMPNGELQRYVNHRSAWLPVLWQGDSALPMGPAQFTFEGFSSSGTSSVRDTRILLWRADAHEYVGFEVAPEPVGIASVNPTTVASLTTAQPAGPRHHVVVQSTTLAGVEYDPDLTRGRRSHFARDGIRLGSYSRYNTTTGPWVPDVWIDLVETAEAMALENTVACEGEELPMEAEQSTLQVLRLRR